jgi:C1A family cysteine protease
VSEFFVGGWRNDLEDRASLEAGSKAFTLAAPGDAPDEIDPRPWLNIENQAQEGSCAGHMMSSILELCNYIATAGQVIQLARMFCYLTGQKQCGLLGGDNGCTIQGVMEAAKQVGICKEDTFPYTGQYSTKIPDAAFVEAKPHTLGVYSMLKNEREVFAFLSSGNGGVGMGVDWRQSLAGNKDGLIESSTGGVMGGHAVPLVGYSKRKDTRGRNYYLLPNSWGKTWGNNGWAEVAPVVVEQFFNEGAAIFGASDLHSFGFRQIKSWGEMFG